MQSLKNLKHSRSAINLNSFILQRLISDGEAIVAWVSTINKYLVLCKINTFDWKLNIFAIRVPVLLISVHDCRFFDVSVNRNLSNENTIFSVKEGLGWHTLSKHHVSSWECLDLPVLEGAILIVESLWSSTCRCSQISVVLELPISPTSNILVSCVTHRINFGCAICVSQTRAKLRNKEGEVKSLCVYITLGKLSHVIIFAEVSIFYIWLTSRTLTPNSAAVCVVVKHVIRWTDLTTWGHFKTNWEDKALAHSNCVRSLIRFKPHDRGGIGGVVSFIVETLVHWCESCLVLETGFKVFGVLKRISKERFV